MVITDFIRCILTRTSYSEQMLSMQYVTHLDTLLTQCFPFQVIEYIINGHILDSPAGCPEEIGKVMLGCWKRMPNERRPMKSIKSILEKLYTDRIDNCNVTEGAEITWIPESVRDSGHGTTFPLNDQELRPNGVFI